MTLPGEGKCRICGTNDGNDTLLLNVDQASPVPMCSECLDSLRHQTGCSICAREREKQYEIHLSGKAEDRYGICKTCRNQMVRREHGPLRHRLEKKGIERFPDIELAVCDICRGRDGLKPHIQRGVIVEDWLCETCRDQGRGMK